ncbi:CBU_0592 family membrane protein [Rhodocytophaga rosea]
MLYRRYILESIGWTGALFSLLAYSLNSLNVILSQSKEYLAMNVLGCFMLIIYTYYKKAYANSVLNTIWLVMTIVALIKVYSLL